jgi:hypothetical protein
VILFFPDIKYNNKETNVYALLELVADANHSAEKIEDNRQLKAFGQLSTEMQNVKSNAYV